MRALMPRFALTLALALSGAIAWPTAPASAEGEFNVVGSFKLPGDLEVITSEGHTLPKVTVDTWVKAGSSADFTGYPGLANATALALWDTGARSLSQALTALGGSPKVEVTRDATHFSVTLPADRLADGMDLIGAAFANPNWSAIDLTGLKARLSADYSRQQADVPAQAFEQLMQALYGPDYGHKPIGQPEATARLTGQDLQAFFDRYYVPAQMKVVLVGDFNTGKTIGQVVRSYAAVLKRTGSSTPPLSRPLAPSSERKSVGTNAEMAAGARGPAMGDQREQATMDMLASVLGDGEKSRLAQALAGQAMAIRSSWEPFKGPGALVIQVTADPKATMNVEKTVRDALADLRTNPVSLDEHARAMATLIRRYDQDNDTLAKQAATLGFFATVGGDPHLARTYPEVVRQVSRTDMLDAAQKYMTPDAVKVVVLSPQ
jgi:zinc protease